MANPFSKGFKYLMASFDNKIDENADPQVQISQAAEAARKQHQDITEHAATLIGQHKQLQMKLDRLRQDQQRLTDQVREALRAAEAAGSEQERATYSNHAEISATQLVAVDRQVEETAQLVAQAANAAEAAKQQQQESSARLEEQLSQINELRAQANQAAMQETAAKAADTLHEIHPDASVPTLDQLRDKIERRYADALGAQELTQATVSDTIADITPDARDSLARARLDEIRAELGQSSDSQSSDSTASAEPKALEGTEGEADAAVEEPDEGASTQGHT